MLKWSLRYRESMLVANLWFDEKNRIRWPTQLDYIIHYTKWREQERQQKLPFGTRFLLTSLIASEINSPQWHWWCLFYKSF